MRKIKLITDSTADLSNELIEKYNIAVIPLTVTIAGHPYLDGIELTTNRMFELIEETGEMPRSSAPAPTLFHDTFKKYIDEDYDIIFTGIAGSMSGTLNVAKMMAKSFPEGRIHFVDSENLSSGIALLLINADRMIKEGKTVEEVVAGMKDVRERIRSQFIVETIDYLYRGGRMTSAKFILGKALRAHPYIVVANGKMDSAELPKGKIKKALKFQLKMFEKHLEEGIDTSTVFITSSGVLGDEHAEYYLEEISKLVPPQNIILQKAGCVISAHCGEGTIGILYVRNVKNELLN